MTERTCDTCGISYDPRAPRPNGKGYYNRPQFCSRQCAGKARRQPILIPCEQCGQPITRAISTGARNKSGGPRFCSIECRGKYFRAHPTNPPLGRKVLYGYVKLYRPEHPYADKNGYVFEHRLVMEESLGRVLEPQEQVHHINHQKDNNRIENLRLFSSNSAHRSFHSKDREERVHSARQQGWKVGVVSCRQCGIEFVPPAYVYYKLQLGGGVYCSRACSDLGHRFRVSRICEKCGKQFEVLRYLAAQGNGRFCSNACKVFGTALLNRPPRTALCAHCGESFKPKGKQRFCQPSCGYAARRSLRL